MREELGWPIVMTPFAQMLQTQAVMNVTGKERYAVIPDEMIRYALGRFGRPNVPIEPEVMDRIMAQPAHEGDPAPSPAWPSCRDLRRRIGAHLSDEEFLLRATMPANLVDAMQAAGPAPRALRSRRLRPVMKLLRELCARARPDRHRRREGRLSAGGAAVRLERRRSKGSCSTSTARWSSATAAASRTT